MFDFKKARTYSTTFTQHRTSVAFDFETTGVHLHHDALPFMMSATWSDGRNTIWQADVDPMTRTPVWAADDLISIAQFFDDVMQPDQEVELIASNAKFDTRCADVLFNKMKALHSINLAKQQHFKAFDGVALLRRCHDTIQEHHVLANAEPHDLKSAAVKYLRMPDTDESDLHAAVTEARKLAISLGWKVASPINTPLQHKKPDKGWSVMDMWLPRAYAKFAWESSAAGKYVATTAVPRPAFADGVTKDQQISASFGNRSDLLQQKSFLSPSELEKAKRLDGWKWRPPSDLWQGCHPWWTLCAEYCSKDTIRSLVLHETFTKRLYAENLYEVYLENRTSLPISYGTENNGITIHYPTLFRLKEQFKFDQENAVWAMTHALGLRGVFNPASTNNVRSILYDFFRLPVLKWTANKNKKRKSQKEFVPQASIDADAIAEFAKLIHPTLTDHDTCAPPLWQRGVESFGDFQVRGERWHKLLTEKESPSPEQIYAFCCALLMYKKCATGLTQLEGWLRNAIPDRDFPNLYGILYPSLNPVGTRTTRYSSSNPNGQNISKGGKKKKGLEWLFKTDHSLRCVFGPKQGREWWAIDYHQIQLAIFAVCAGDKKMIAAFERGEDFHTFVAKEIFGDEFDPDPESSTHKSQRDIAKTVNFAFIFGAQEAKLNASSGMPGLYDRLKKVFPAAIAYLVEIENRVKKGLPVYTLGGYRLTVPESAPYSGVCYIVQGTEGEIVKRAQYGIEAYLQQPNHTKNVLAQSVVAGNCISSAFGRIGDIFKSILYVHDELLFEAPVGLGQQHIGPIIRIMNDAAASFGIPTTAEPSLIPENWGKKTKVSV